MISRRLLPFLATPALAQSFPDRPIRMIVPYSAGGTTDTQMRAFAEAASRHLGQPVIIENRPGGGGIMGAQLLAGGARADGYTLAQMPVSVFRHPHMMGRPAFDPMVDFTWVMQVTGYLFGLVVRADAPWRTLAEFVAASRTAPLAYATTGVGSSMHITMERVGVGGELIHTPFRGTAEALTALMGGQIAAVAASSDWARAVQEGRLRLLFTTGEARPRRFPDAPTLREIGHDIVVTSPYGVAAPRGLPPEITQRLHAGLRAALYDPSHLAVLDRLDMAPAHLDPDAYATEARRWFEEEREVVRRFNLRG